MHKPIERLCSIKSEDENRAFHLFYTHGIVILKMLFRSAKGKFVSRKEQLRLLKVSDAAKRLKKPVSAEDEHCAEGKLESATQSQCTVTGNSFVELDHSYFSTCDSNDDCELLDHEETVIDDNSDDESKCSD